MQEIALTAMLDAKMVSFCASLVVWIDIKQAGENKDYLACVPLQSLTYPHISFKKTYKSLEFLCV
jgi:hypothetical protein